MARKYQSVLYLLICLPVMALAAPEIKFSDNFESGLQNWAPLSHEDVFIIDEPGTDNRVLQLTPHTLDYSHALLNDQSFGPNVRMEGRFLFPTEGDGYLGFIYNYTEGVDRFDFGCLYVKSNGSYVRVSPHYDGNPSWRLYEEMKVDLVGDRAIVPGQWHHFRLEVNGGAAALYIDDMAEPIVVFDGAPGISGQLGLEARPGRGDPVWVDDVVVSEPPARSHGKPGPAPPSKLGKWQYQTAIEDPLDATLAAPDLAEEAWMDISPDKRGAIISGLLTQTASGNRNVVYLRASFEVPEGIESGWLALSSANRLDSWSGGYYRGSVAPESYIWSDHTENSGHPGARLPLLLKPGRQALLLRVYGDRFAGGGFYADIVFAE
jgi:hypothetical protein